MQLDSIASYFEEMRHEIGKTIVWQDELVQKTLIALFSGGHVLLEWVPGLAKTLFSETLASVLDAGYSRIQFTPDLLPSDVIGSEIYRPQTGEFFVKQWPIVANIVLADEINRAPSKVQSALLEAMQEKKLSIANETISLPKPFFVIATMNPIDQEGTYELPEASLDRFFFQVRVEYPTKEEEMEIALRISSGTHEDTKKILTPKLLEEIQNTIESEIFVDPKIYSYAVDIVRASREKETFSRIGGESGVENPVFFGASPRASIALVRAAKTLSACTGRDFVTPDDIKSVAHEILRHRIRLSYGAIGAGISADNLVDEILRVVRIP